MKQKKFFTIFLIFILSLSLISCSNDNISKDNNNLEKFKVVLDWYPNAVHSFIYNAIEKGYYEEEGLDVEIYFPSNTNDAISLTSVGKADIGIYYMQDIIKAISKENIPIKSVGTIVQGPLNVIASLKEKNIKSPKDLKGKTIGYSGTELAEQFIETMLESEGLTLNDVNLIEVGFDLMTAMTTNNVDATNGCMINHEIPFLEEEGFEMNYFYPTDYGIPNLYELVFVSNDKLINENPEKIEKFLRASKKGFEYMKNNIDESLKILIENQNKENFPLVESVERKSFEILIPIMEKEGSPFLTQDKSIWQNNINWLKEKEMIERDISISDCVYDILK